MYMHALETLNSSKKRKSSFCKLRAEDGGFDCKEGNHCMCCIIAMQPIDNYDSVSLYSGQTTSQNKRNGRPLRMHQDSSQIESYLNPVKGIREQQIRQGKTPVNHAKNNVIAVKQQSRLNADTRQKQEQENLAPRSKIPLWNKIQQKQSKLLDGVNEDKDRNFVNENILNSGVNPPKTSKPVNKVEQQKAEQRWIAKESYGKVPRYLQQRKIQLAADYAKRQAGKEKQLIPPGMRLMAEQERQQTLAILQKNRDEVDKKLQKLPFILETPSQIRYRNGLEERLREIDEAEKVFSRPKVLVQIDDDDDEFQHNQDASDQQSRDEQQLDDFDDVQQDQ